MKEINFKKYEAILHELHNSEYIKTKHYEKLLDKSIILQSDLMLYGDIVDEYAKYLRKPGNITFFDTITFGISSGLLYKYMLHCFYKIERVKRKLHKRVVKLAIERYPKMSIVLEDMPKEVREDIDFVLYTLATTRIEENV